MKMEIYYIKENIKMENLMEKEYYLILMKLFYIMGLIRKMKEMEKE